jgi:hypothetical protein
VWWFLQREQAHACKKTLKVVSWRVDGYRNQLTCRWFRSHVQSTPKSVSTLPDAAVLKHLATTRHN